MTRNTFNKFTNAVYTVLKEGKIPTSAKIRFVESLARQVKSKRFVTEELDVEQAFYKAVDTTFGKIKLPDFDPLFPELYYELDERGDITYLYLYAADSLDLKKAHDRQLPIFLKKVKNLPGITVDVEPWEGTDEDQQWIRTLTIHGLS